MATRHQQIKKASADLLAAALLWHALKSFWVLYPNQKEDKKLQRAAKRWLKLNPNIHEMKRLGMAMPKKRGK